MASPAGPQVSGSGGGNEAIAPISPAATSLPTSPGQDGLISTNGSGNVPLSVLRPSSAVIAAQRAQMGVLARAGQENAILTAVRKQMENLEEKLTHQITRAQQQGDKQRDASSSRFDTKLTAIEGYQPRLDRRTAELAGNIRGLSDEMQCQIRRVDQCDSRLMEWRHQIEEEIRTKLTQIEANQESMASSIRVAKAASDDMNRAHNQKLLKLETQTEERAHTSEHANQSILQLHTRLTELEDAECERARTQAVSPHGDTQLARSGAAPEAVSNPQERLAVASIEQQVAEMQRKMAEVQAESHEFLTRVESQEERYKTLRTMQDAKEEQYRNLGERLEKENWDQKFKDFQVRMQEFDKQGVAHSEKLEIMSNKLTNQGQAHEELGNSMRRLQERSSDALALMAAGDLDPCSPTSPYAQAFGSTIGSNLGGGAVAGGVEERLKEAEERIEQAGRELQIMRSDNNVSNNVASLVAMLQEVAPKVIGHEQILQDVGPKLQNHEALLAQLREDISAKGAGSPAEQGREDIAPKLASHGADIMRLQEDLGTGLNLLGSQYKAVGKSMEAIEARVGRIETEVCRLVDEVEGGEYQEAVGAIAEAEEAEDEQDAEEVAPNLRKQRRASSTE